MVFSPLAMNSLEDIVPQNSRFVKEPPVVRLRDSNDALAPHLLGEKIIY